MTLSMCPIVEDNIIWMYRCRQVLTDVDKGKAILIKYRAGSIQIHFYTRVRIERRRGISGTRYFHQYRPYYFLMLFKDSVIIQHIFNIHIINIRGEEIQYKCIFMISGGTLREYGLLLFLNKLKILSYDFEMILYKG